jgi:hypothetical protein
MDFIFNHNKCGLVVQAFQILHDPGIIYARIE